MIMGRVGRDWRCCPVTVSKSFINSNHNNQKSTSIGKSTKTLIKVVNPSFKDTCTFLSVSPDQTLLNPIGLTDSIHSQ